MSKLTDALEGARPAFKAEFDRLAAEGEAECRAAIAEAVAILALFPDLARAQEAAKIQKAVEWIESVPGHMGFDAECSEAGTAWMALIVTRDSRDHGHIHQAEGPTLPEAVAALRLKQGTAPRTDEQEELFDVEGEQT